MPILEQAFVSAIYLVLTKPVRWSNCIKQAFITTEHSLNPVSIYSFHIQDCQHFILN